MIIPQPLDYFAVLYRHQVDRFEATGSKTRWGRILRPFGVLGHGSPQYHGLGPHLQQTEQDGHLHTSGLWKSY
jgi:hypothetical protein